MRKVFSIIAALLFAGSAYAQEVTPVISGEVALDFTQDANDDWGGAMGLDLGIDVAGAADVDLDFSATDGNAITLDNWTVGTTINSVGVAIGDDNGVMPDAEGNQTLAAPAMTESVQVTVGAAQIAVGFTDWTADITDVSNIQGAYTMDVAGLDVTAAGDYNMDTENTVLGAGVDGLSLGAVAVGGALSYDLDAENIGFEGTVETGSITAYLNGDQDDTLQNIGGEYVYGLGGAELTAGANYNLDTEDFTPTVGLSFSF